VLELILLKRYDHLANVVTIIIIIAVNVVVIINISVHFFFYLKLIFLFHMQYSLEISLCKPLRNETINSCFILNSINCIILGFHPFQWYCCMHFTHLSLIFYMPFLNLLLFYCYTVHYRI